MTHHDLEQGELTRIHEKKVVKTLFSTSLLCYYMYKALWIVFVIITPIIIRDISTSMYETLLHRYQFAIQVWGLHLYFLYLKT